MMNETSTKNSDVVEQNKTLTLVVYALQAIVGVVINYVKKPEVQGTWLASHFKWQIRTFWWSFLGFVIGFFLSFIFIGIFVYILTYIWVIYRVVKGFLRFNSQQAMYVSGVQHD